MTDKQPKKHLTAPTPQDIADYMKKIREELKAKEKK